MLIRRARPGEATALTALGLRSKAHWGYDDEFMARVATELRWSEDDLRRLLVHVAEGEDGTLLGFAAVNPDTDPPELDALFVEPAATGSGAGRALLRAAVAAAADRGIDRLVVDSDPQAEGFYVRMGARRVGESRSTSTGRLLPRLELPVSRDRRPGSEAQLGEQAEPDL